MINIQDLSWTKTASLDLGMEDVSLYVIDNPDTRGCGAVVLENWIFISRGEKLDSFLNRNHRTLSER